MSTQTTLAARSRGLEKARASQASRQPAPITLPVVPGWWPAAERETTPLTSEQDLPYRRSPSLLPGAGERSKGSP